MTAKAFVKYFFIFIIGLLIIGLVYLKISFEQPTVSAIEDVQLNSLSDSGSVLILTLKIKNPNSFSIKIKDLKIELNEFVNGSIAESPIRLPAKSEEIYQVPITIRYGKIENLFKLADSTKPSTATVHLQAKPAFWFSYLDFTEEVSNNNQGNFIPELMAAVVKKNIIIKKIHWPKEINTERAEVTIDVELNNPYDIQLQMNHYEVKVFDDSAQTALLGQLSNDSSFTIPSHSSKIFSNKIFVKPMQSAMDAALRMLQGNLSYYVLLGGNVGIGSYESKFTTGFLVNPFNL